jgi:hypothetical protein
MPQNATKIVVVVAAALALAACATPTPIKDTSGLSRETPEATYEYFKTMARNNQWANEWMVFSPNFKQMINQAAGRNVDLGDYSMARQALPEAKNSSTEMQMLLNSTLEGVQYLGPDRARVTIVGGGRRVSPLLVRMTRWELKIRDQDTPASGTVSRPGDAIQVNADGSITVRVTAEPGVAAALRTVPRDEIEGFAIKSEWYVDDFGGLVGNVGPAQTQPQAQPGAFPPAGAGAPPPAATGGLGSGSPDG